MIEAIDSFKSNKIPENFAKTFNSWISKQKEYFLSGIDEIAASISQDTLEYIRKDLNPFGNNMEVQFLYLMIELKIKKLDETVTESLENFLKSIGRMKYIRDLYNSYYDYNSEAAKKSFTKNKGLYHTILVNLIEKDFATKENSLKFLDA